MTQQMTHALVAAIYDGELSKFVDEQSVFLFPSEEDAVDGALLILDAEGADFERVPVPEGATLDRKKKVLREYQDQLGSIEYFHIFPVKQVALQEGAELSDAVLAIGQERLRQERKGWTSQHDDEHQDGSLLVAGILIACGVADLELTIGPPELQGPWPDQLAVYVAKKHGDNHIRRLTIAAAMIAAEIDRLQRVEAASPI